MKLLIITLILWVATTGSSFISDDSNAASKCTFKALVNGAPFDAGQQHLSVMLLNQPGSLDGRRPARKIISIIQNGASYMTTDGRLFNETVQFAINFEEALAPEPSVYNVSLQYHSVVYSLLMQPGDLKVTAFEWEPDHRHFRMSFDFNCTMRSWGYPADNNPDVRLQGQIKDITVAAPMQPVLSDNRSF